MATMDMTRLPKMKFYGLLLSSIMLVGIFFSSAMSSLNSSANIRSSGTIATTPPLHVDGRYIKDSSNRTIYLRGVWAGMFADTSTGWWGLDAFTWDEAALRYTLQTLRQQWGANCISFMIWGDWWLGNKAVTVGGGSTNIGDRDAIVKTVQIAAEYGIYIQIRLFGCTKAEGRREGLPFQPTYAWMVQDFVNFWANVSATLKDYPNVLYCLFDEPTGDEATYFNACAQAINAIRATGSDQLIVIHWYYCGDMMWVAHWVNGGYPLRNIVFSEHIYRNSGTFAFNSNSPVNIDYIRNFLTNPRGAYYTGTGTKYIIDTYNVPIWVSAIGCYNGATDDEEYVAFTNTLEVLNEWGIGYVAWHAFRTALWSTILQNPTGLVFSPPNRLGQSLINAIAGIVPPPTYNIDISTNVDPVQYTLNGTSHTSPYNLTEFSGNYTISMPTSKTAYVHHVLFGSTATEGLAGRSGSSYLYAVGPYSLSQNTTVTTINLYVSTSGNAKVAIYGQSSGNISNLIVASQAQSCTVGWNTFNVSATNLTVGNYYLTFKTDTNNMVPCIFQGHANIYISDSYSNPFPNPFGIGTVGGSLFPIYVPTSPFSTTTYNFTHWEDNSTNPERMINLTTNMNLTATYQPAT